MTTTRRLWIEPARLAAAQVVITDEDYHYLCRVLRLAQGDRLVLFDGVGTEADAEIARIGPRALELRVLERHPAMPPRGPELVLMQGLAKGDKLDLVVQKATELGVTRILPVITQRSIEQLDIRRADARRQRWEKIAREAARQSGRVDVPQIEPVALFVAAVVAAPADALRLLLTPEARYQHPLRSVLPKKPPARAVIAVGPEGGFTTEEMDLARRVGFHSVGLGPRVLRTETAALAALAVLGFAIGDLSS